MPNKLSRWFRRSNYRAFVDRSLWLAAWRSAKRAHKDKRARKHILLVGASIGFLLLLLAGCIAYLMFIVGSGAWFFIPFVVPVSWWIRRSAKREFEPINITPQPALLPTTPEQTPRSQLIAYFSKLALLYGVLVDRAGSESYLKRKTLPEGSEVITRRTHLDLLRTYEVWDHLAPKDREALMMSDGDWDWNRINQAFGGVEMIRCLRWILMVDFALPLVALRISTDFSAAHELVQKPQLIVNAVDLVDVNAIRNAREQAHIILLRCLAESISRGYLVSDNTEMIAWAKDVSSSLHGKQNEDFLIGDKLVSEVSEDELSWTLSIARIRHEFLQCAEALIDGSQALPREIASIFRQSNSNQNPDEARRPDAAG